MKRPFVLVGVLIVAVAAAGSLWWFFRQPAVSYPDARRVSYRVTVSNTTNRALEGGKLWLAAPQELTPSQRLDGLSSTLDYSVVSDQYANQQLEFALPVLPPYGQLEIAVEAQLKTAPVPNHWADEAPAYWSQPQQGIPSDHPRIREVAATLEQGDEPVAAIAQWLDANLERANYDSLDRGALWALEQRSGDCSEFAFLGAALARALGWPARVVEGWVVEADGALQASGFHAWTEVWVDGTWRVLDAHRQGRDEASGSYVAFRVVPPDPEAFSASFTRFRFAGEGLTVLMH